MLDAQVALSTQYTTTSELGKVMEQLDQSAMAWRLLPDSRRTTWQTPSPTQRTRDGP
ncbi:MAG: hypothetical protein ACLUI3_00240 [Christensenellales bacterium]